MERDLVSLQKIIEQVQSDCFKETKTLNGIFVDMNAAMGVSVDSLKNDQGRYKFAETGKEFWTSALTHYTDPPYIYIRDFDYQKIPSSVIRSYMDMVVETMQIAGKPRNEIENVLLNVEDTTRYDDRLFQSKITHFTEILFRQYTDEIANAHFLLWGDRLQILGYLEKELIPMYFGGLIEQAKEIIQRYFLSPSLHAA